MESSLRDLLWKICLCYLDDIVIFGRTPQELLERLRTVLDRLREAGLKVKPSKCELFKTSIKFLGHLVSADGIDPLPEKIVGLASYYRRFVRGFASIAEPLMRLMRKMARFEWTEEAQQAFGALKTALIDATLLAFPQPNVPCTCDTDASDVGIGGAISHISFHLMGSNGPSHFSPG